MEYCVGDDAVGVHEAPADDARDQDPREEQPVELAPARRRNRVREVGRAHLPAQGLRCHGARLGLDGPLCAPGDLAVDDREHRDPGSQQHHARVEREPQDQPRTGMNVGFGHDARRKNHRQRRAPGTGGGGKSPEWGRTGRI